MLDRKNPLVWPDGEPRTPFNEKRSRSLFQTSEEKTHRQLEDELRRFNAVDIIVSFNNATRSGKIEDTAVALYFDLPDGRKIAICSDLYYQRSDNLRAVYMVIEAMRTIERYGGKHLSQKSFTGFAALPPPKDIWSILGLNQKLGQGLNQRMRREYVMDGFRTKVKETHSAGGDMAALVEARDLALKELGVTDA